jgi:integrase
VQRGEGNLVIQGQEKITFNDFKEKFLEDYAKKLKSYEKVKGSLNLLSNYIGKKCLHEIDRYDIARFITERRKKVKAVSVNRDLSHLRKMFNCAKDWKFFLGDNPVSQKGRTQKDFVKENPRQIFLEKEQVVKLIKAIDVLVARRPKQYIHLKPIVLTALLTGMRKGEILNLKWRDVNFNQNFIHIEETKNGEPRNPPLNPLLKTILIKVKKREDSAYIFWYRNGKPYRNIPKSFFTACEDAGIIIGSDTKETRFRFHDLRHTFASHYLMGGGDLVSLARILGHKDAKMTQRYSHFSKEYTRRIVDNMGDTFSQMLGCDSQKVVKSAEITDFSENADFSNSLVLQEITN